MTGRPGLCRAMGCEVRMMPDGLFCPRHWAQVPEYLQRLICRHHRPGKRATRVLQTYLDEAVRVLLYVKTEGHLPPSPTSFEWDDAPPAPPEEQLPLKEDP